MYPIDGSFILAVAHYMTSPAPHASPALHVSPASYASVGLGVVQTFAVGARVAKKKTWNDFTEFGGFPNSQNIERIRKVEIWADDRVNGIKVSYGLKSGEVANTLRGHPVGTATFFDVKDVQTIIGICGRRDEQDYIGTLTFVVVDDVSGKVSVYGPYGQPPNPGKPFRTAGSIIAFAGTTQELHGLCTLSFYKTLTDKIEI